MAKTVAKPVLTPVKSSNLKAIAYDAGARDLFVLFNTNHLYKYMLVAPEIFGALVSAQSKGKFFAQNIRNVFAYQKIKLEDWGNYVDCSQLR